MYKERTTRVGLIVTMSPDETWPDSIVNRVKSYLPGARGALQKLGMKVVDCGTIARTTAAMAEQGEQLRRQGIHVLVIYVGTWTYSSTSVIASMKADVPVIVWANSSIETFGIVACGTTISSSTGGADNDNDSFVNAFKYPIDNGDDYTLKHSVFNPVFYAFEYSE